MIILRRSMRLAALCCAVTVTLLAQTRPAAPRTPRIYIFENGAIKGLDVALFNFKREEIKEPDFVNISYMIVHPRGTMMLDSGAIPDASF